MKYIVKLFLIFSFSLSNEATRKSKILYAAQILFRMDPHSMV